MLSVTSILPGESWKHPNPRLQSAWNWTRIGFVIFPLLPSIGAVAILTALVKTWRQVGNEITQNRFNWGFTILTPWLIFLSITTPHPFDAFVGLANFVPYFLFFATFSTLIQSPEQLRQIVLVLLIPSIPVMLLGWLQLFGWGGTLVFPILPTNIWEIAVGGNPLGRMSSVFAHANGLAAYLQMVFIFILGLLVDACNRPRQTGEMPEMTKIIQPFWKSATVFWLIILLLLCTGSILMTSSRAAWAGMFLVSLIFTIYQGWYWILGAITAIATVMFGAAYGPDPLKQSLRSIIPRYFWARITDEMYPDRPESMTRLSQWKFAWQMTQDRPVTGWGMQSFSSMYQEYAHIWLGYPHNLLLMLTSNVGIPATIVLFCLVGWILGQGVYLFIDFPLEWQSDRIIFFTYLLAFFGFILVNIADVTVFDLRNNTYAWTILASIYGLARHSR
jgi:O-antigen ligase